MSDQSAGGSEVPPTWRTWLQTHNFSELVESASDSSFPPADAVWAPDDADRSASWRLYSELRTRISTQALSYRAGDERAALDSVYKLFELSRETIKEYPGCTHFAGLTVHILNRWVRPFTSRWHQVSVDGRLSGADTRYAFRRDLASLQVKLRLFTRLLGILAGDIEQIIASEAQSQIPPNTPAEILWAPLEFGIGAGTPGTDAIRESLNTEEATEVRARRSYYRLGDASERTNAVGLSISGGGIRSATFALGVVSQLSRAGILRQVDFLSTVSGGGYLGAFITSFLAGSDARIGLSSSSGSLPFGGAGDGESQGVRQLRNHSKYLVEGGWWTFATLMALGAYGVICSILLIAPFLLASVLVATHVFGASFRNPLPYLPFSRRTDTVAGALGVAVLLLPLVQRAFRGQRPQRVAERVCVALALLTLALFAFEALPPLLGLSQRIGGPSRFLVVVLALPIMLAVLGLWLGTYRAGRVAVSLVGVAGPLIIVAAFLWLTTVFLSGSEGMLLLLTVATFLYASFILNINLASPHSYYRDRLARTYLVHAVNGPESVCVADSVRLSAINALNKAPYHLINCAINVPSCKDPNLRGRNTDFFLFSKHWCGSPIAGYEKTPKWEALDSHLDLGTAIAISGAAAAPHMGTLTSRSYTFLLAMLNVRLSYWVRRPLAHSSGLLGRLSAPMGWWYFFRELTGLMSERTRYLNLSDGGHIENLGIYELLRRRCKFIIAIDGEADPERSFGGLLTLTQLAKIDLGASIEPDLSDLRPDREGHGRSHFGLSKIIYPDGQYGMLLYIKSSLTGNESEFLKRYRSENPQFPHQSTLQQLFSETQFEAYRELGEHIARDLFRSDLVAEWKQEMSAQEWFRRLATQLLD